MFRITERGGCIVSFIAAVGEDWSPVWSDLYLVVIEMGKDISLGIGALILGFGIGIRFQNSSPRGDIVV